MHRLVDYKQVGVMVALGAGTMLLKQRPSTDYGSNHLLSATQELKHHPNLAKVVCHMEALHQPVLLQRLIRTVDQILVIANHINSQSGAMHLKAYAVQLNRHIVTASAIAKDLTREAKKIRDASVEMACVDCIEDDIPALQNIFESILHNAMPDVQS